MRPLHFRTLLALCALAAVVMVPAPASARSTIVGIGDQKAETFTQPLFKALKVKRTRLITPWNSITAEPARLDQWMKAARAARLEPVIAFNHARTDKCPARPCKLPSVSQYTRAFKKFRRKYKYVKNYQPWNEANSPTQPTGKNPKRAAQYYNAILKNCKRCNITAADLLDLGLDKRSGKKRFAKYVKTFRRFANGNPRLWGFHNYGDTNRNRSVGTKFMLRQVPGQIWLTETGGIFQFISQSGVAVLPASESRQTRATKQMFTLAKRYRSRISRLYIYQWSANFAGDRFDAGLVNLDGTPRGAYNVVKKNRRLIR